MFSMKMQVCVALLLVGAAGYWAPGPGMAIAAPADCIAVNPHRGADGPRYIKVPCTVTKAQTAAEADEVYRAAFHPASPILSPPAPTARQISGLTRTKYDFIEGDAEIVLPGSVNFTSPDDLNGGLGFSFSAGEEIPAQLFGFGDGALAQAFDIGQARLGAELKVDHTHREFAAFPGDFIDTTGIFGVGRVSYPLNNRINVYGGLGLGAFAVNEVYPTGGTGVGPGYIGLIGGEVKLTDAISGITELDVERSFGPIHASNGFDVQTDVTKVSVGLRFDFDEPAPAGR
jgi:hypothetical protein